MHKDSIASVNVPFDPEKMQDRVETHSGWLTKSGASTLSKKQKRWFVLYEDKRFAYFTDQRMKTMKGEGSFITCRAEDVVIKGKHLIVLGEQFVDGKWKTRQWKLIASDAASAETWREFIIRPIQEEESASFEDFLDEDSVRKYTELSQSGAIDKIVPANITPAVALPAPSNVQNSLVEDRVEIHEPSMEFDVPKFVHYIQNSMDPDYVKRTWRKHNRNDGDSISKKGFRKVLYSIIIHYWTHEFGAEADFPREQKTSATIDQIVSILLEDNADGEIFREELDTMGVQLMDFYNDSERNKNLIHERDAPNWQSGITAAITPGAASPRADEDEDPFSHIGGARFESLSLTQYEDIDVGNRPSIRQMMAPVEKPELVEFEMEPPEKEFDNPIVAYIALQQSFLVARNKTVKEYNKNLEMRTLWLNKVVQRRRYAREQTAKNCKLRLRELSDSLKIAEEKRSADHQRRRRDHEKSVQALNKEIATRSRFLGAGADISPREMYILTTNPHGTKAIPKKLGTRIHFHPDAVHKHVHVHEDEHVHEFVHRHIYYDKPEDCMQWSDSHDAKNYFHQTCIRANSMKKDKSMTDDPKKKKKVSRRDAKATAV